MIPAGWTIKRADKGPFKRIELWRQYNGMRYGTVVDSLARNPENILYMLAEDLLAQDIPTLPMSEASGTVFVFHPEDPMLQLLPEGTHVVLQRRIPTPKDGVPASDGSQPE